MSSTEENGNASALRAPGELRRDLPTPTPGPWRVRRLGTHHRIEADALSHFSGHNMAICELQQWSNGCGPDVVQQAVNARLIASAPCLLEALKGFEAWWDGPFAQSLISAGFTGVRVGPQTQTMLDGIRAALARATKSEVQS